MAASERRVLFVKDYNHRWTSRAITHFKVTGEPITVKAEVAAAAIEKGYAEPAPRGKAAASGETQHQASGPVDGRDPAPGDDDLDGSTGDRRGGLDDSGEAGVSADPGA